MKGEEYIDIGEDENDEGDDRPPFSDLTGIKTVFHFNSSLVANNISLSSREYRVGVIRVERGRGRGDESYPVVQLSNCF